MNEEAFDFATAAANYAASRTLQPKGAYSAQAAIRGEYLRSHSEGDFAPLVRLERLRRDPARANDPIAIEALVHDAADFAPGLVRVESRLLAAEAYRGRLHSAGAEVPLLWEVVRDPYADVLSARQAAAEIVASETNQGHLEAALDAVHELRGELDPSMAATVDRLLRRRWAHTIALVEMGVFFALLTLALLRRRGGGALAGVRRILPLAAAFCLFVAGGGGLLASSYEAGSAGPFFVLGAAILGISLLSRAWSSIGSKRVSARLGRSMVAASCVVAATFLLLEKLTPQVLDGFGL
jgi:hypothetical protein